MERLTFPPTGSGQNSYGKAELPAVTCTQGYTSKLTVSGERSPLFISPLHPGG